MHITIYFVLIIFFAYFYVGITFNPDERADDMKKYGGFIPASGRAARPPSTCSSCCRGSHCPGPLYLGIVAILPNFFFAITER